MDRYFIILGNLNIVFGCDDEEIVIQGILVFFVGFGKFVGNRFVRYI